MQFLHVAMNRISKKWTTNVPSFTYRRSDHTKAGVTVEECKASAAAAKCKEIRVKTKRDGIEIFIVLQRFSMSVNLELRLQMCYNLDLEM